MFQTEDEIDDYAGS